MQNGWRLTEPLVQRPVTRAMKEALETELAWKQQAKLDHNFDEPKHIAQEHLDDATAWRANFLEERKGKYNFPIRSLYAPSLRPSRGLEHYELVSPFCPSITWLLH